MRGLGLPPMWRAGLIMIVLALIAATIYWILTIPAETRVPEWSPTQLPTLGIEP